MTSVKSSNVEHIFINFGNIQIRWKNENKTYVYALSGENDYEIIYDMVSNVLDNHGFTNIDSVCEFVKNHFNVIHTIDHHDDCLVVFD